MEERTRWKFLYSVNELGAAALEKRDFHQERWDHWRAELDAAERDLKENGIDIRAAVAAGQTGSSAYRAEPILDAVMLKRITECNNKIAEHRGLTEDYALFARIMRREVSSATFELTADDVKFFGL